MRHSAEKMIAGAEMLRRRETTRPSESSSLFAKICLDWGDTLTTVFMVITAWTATATTFALCLQANVAHSQEAAADDGSNQPGRVGYLVQVELPLVGERDEQVRKQVLSILDSVDTSNQRPVIVLKFSSASLAGEPDDAGLKTRGSRFERSLALARFLTSAEAARARMVAYLPESVEGHAVLPVLACEEILAAPDAELGRATIDEPLEDTIAAAYESIVKRRASLPLVVVRAMLDPTVQVNSLELSDRSFLIADQEESQTLMEKGEVVRQETLWFGGTLLVFSGQEMNDRRWISQTVSHESDLPAALQLSETLRTANQLPREWKPIQITLNGELSATRTNQIVRSLGSRIDDGESNLVIFQIGATECDFRQASRLANYATELNSKDVYTVAIIKETISGPIGLVAVACREVALLNEASFDASSLTGKAEATKVVESESVQRVLGDLAISSKRPLPLVSVIVDPTVVVSEFIDQETGKRAIFANWQIESRVDGNKWLAKEEIAGNGVITADVALKYRLVDSVDESAAITLSRLGVTETPAELSTPWLDSTIQMVLAQGWLPRLLLTIGFFALMAELGNPGLGAGGLVAALCFVGFFWIEGLNGNVAGLEILLFVCGLIALSLEIFVIPGFGVFGISGLLMLFVSVVLASQTFIWPTTSAELSEVSVNLFWVACLAMSGMIGLLFMHKQLERLPIFRWVSLSPEEDIEDLDYRESLAHRDHLLGETGLTTTRLNPSGKAQFGSSIVAVVGTGQMISEGVPVQVVEVRGNLVLVEEVS